MTQAYPLDAPLPSRQGSRAVTIFLVVLTIITLAQTIQSFIILNNIRNVGAATSAANSSSAAKSAPLPSSLNNLPNMVGGC